MSNPTIIGIGGGGAGKTTQAKTSVASRSFPQSGKSNPPGDYGRWQLQKAGGIRGLAQGYFGLRRSVTTASKNHSHILMGLCRHAPNFSHSIAQALAK